MQWRTEALHNWEELRLYYDTALFPVYLYQTSIPIPEHARKMNYLANMAQAIEERVKGRVLLFPLSYQFGEQTDTVVQLPEDFSHYILLQYSGHHVKGKRLPEKKAEIHYFTIGTEDLQSSVRFDVTVDVLTKEIYEIWQKRK